MAARWSSDFIIAEYREIQAKTITLDSSGNILLLPGKEQLVLKNLNEPMDTIYTFPRVGKHEPAAASWNPHSSCSHCCAVACGAGLELYILKNENELTLSTVLKSHTRSITNLSWSPFDQNKIATSSLDTNTFVWDIREPTKPTITLSSFSPGYHAKWSKFSKHLLATVHNGDVKIWDERSAAEPLQYISAHSENINCLDWSPFKENQISTCSQDGTIKFFDINEPNKIENLINVEMPAWRAFYTPFGRGILVVIGGKTENNLLLWNLTNSSVPLHTFVGHTEFVLEFQWRSHHQDGSDYQLITWSKDQTLRIWEVEKYLQELCGAFSSESEDEFECSACDSVSNQSTLELCLDSKPSSTLRREDHWYHSDGELNLGARSSIGNGVVGIEETSSGSSSGSSSGVGVLVGSLPHSATRVVSPHPFPLASPPSKFFPTNLQQEFSHDINVPTNVHIHKKDLIRRMCCASVKCNGQSISLLINFPPSYPRNRGPIFRFAQGTTVSNSIRFKILESLRDTAEFKVRNNQPCLESCLRTLSVIMEQLTSDDPTKFKLDRPLSEKLSNQDIYYIPGRTCGAKFCHVGKFVCFAKPMLQFDKNVRSLVGLSTKQTEALTRLYTENRTGSLPPRTQYMIRRGLMKKAKNTDSSKRTVLVYDVSVLFHLNRDLASNYRLLGTDMVAVCTHNAIIANRFGRRDLHHVWMLAATTLRAIDKPSNFYINSKADTVPWYSHPLCKSMIQSIIWHYMLHSDIQTVAMLSCVFQRHFTLITDRVRYLFQQLKRESLSHQTMNQSDGSSWCVIEANQRTRSRSWSEDVERLRQSLEETSVESEGSNGGGSGSEAEEIGREISYVDSCSLSNLSLEMSDFLFGSASPPTSTTIADNASNNFSSNPSREQQITPKATQLEENDVINRLMSNSCWGWTNEGIAPGEAYDAEISDCRSEDIYERVRWEYAEVLYRWGLLAARATILKCSPAAAAFASSHPHCGLQLIAECTKCRNSAPANLCHFCKLPTLYCVICRISVKGLANVCVRCGHGGHSQHMQEWYQLENQCPTGCKCKCLLSTVLT